MKDEIERNYKKKSIKENSTDTCHYLKSRQEAGKTRPSHRVLKYPQVFFREGLLGEGIRLTFLIVNQYVGEEEGNV